MEYAGFFVLLLFFCAFLSRASKGWCVVLLVCFYGLMSFTFFDFEKFYGFSMSVLISAPIVFLSVALWLWRHRKDKPSNDGVDDFYDFF